MPRKFTNVKKKLYQNRESGSSIMTFKKHLQDTLMSSLELQINKLQFLNAFSKENEEYLNSIRISHKPLRNENNKIFTSKKNNKTENINNHDPDITGFNNICSRYFNIIQNKESKCRYNCLEKCSSRKKDDTNTFSLISNYRKKLLSKKPISEASKYFLTKYVKGKKCISNYTSKPIQIGSFDFTQLPMQFEQFIYLFVHFRLSDPLLPLYQQVLLSNFMYNYISLIRIKSY
ncbi:hypothetical protein PNEG_03385 [Pneumocystis murina B123]|uniref:Protein Zds1 C-terminal domain-containing protein n=1 Tax=Pneumocystis murina (strain B123) TaxID=1069680 RepID=M7NM50_PNEMU|nr:hypothetical protein PNEG_03385 [Pneumocystis murina B123]EMR08216.1 hypothetical protein PNEG_03385 [Pneumocystis murina B123]